VKNKNVLLVQSDELESLRAETQRDLNMNTFPPMGLLYIATILEQNGFNVKLVDLTVDLLSQDTLVEILKEFNPGVVGVSVQAASFSTAIEIARLTKMCSPDTMMVFGGPFVTFVYEEALKHPHVDCVVLFEGEMTMLEICKSASEGKGIPPGIAGIAARNNGSIQMSPANGYIKDLDAIPIPSREFLKKELYSTPFTVISARGCPGDCIFCSAKAFWGKAYRARSAKSIFEEVRYLSTQYPEMDHFMFADDTFTVHRQRVFEFCRLMTESSLRIPWGCLSRVDVIDEELITKMRAAGCYRIKFGIENGSNDILKSIGKRITVEKVEEAIRLAHEARMLVNGSIILGLPQDTMQTMKKTIEFAVYLKEKYDCRMQVGINTPFPGTPEYEKPEAFGLRIETRDWDLYTLRHPIATTKHFTREDLYGLYYDAIEELLDLDGR
jgi:radical SAM superfamily enzyme YgiQ (UPF0313 family)